MPDSRLDVLHALFGLLNERRYADLGNLLEEDAVFDVAYYPRDAPGPNPTVGRAAITAMFTDLVAGLFEPFEFTVVECYLGVDPEVAVVEYSSRGVARPTGRPYQNRYVGVLRIRDGRLCLWREYHNPEEMTAAFGSASGGSRS